jgi:hypothetical protein
MSQALGGGDRSKYKNHHYNKNTQIAAYLNPVEGHRLVLHGRVPCVKGITGSKVDPWHSMSSCYSIIDLPSLMMATLHPEGTQGPAQLHAKDRQWCLRQYSTR